MTAQFEIAVIVEAAGKAGQDRAAFAPHGDEIVIALADGACGTGGGALAAQTVIDAVAKDRATVDFASLLVDLEADPERLGYGQTTRDPHARDV